MIKTYNHRMKEDLFQKSRVCTLDAEGKMHEKRLETATKRHEKQTKRAGFFHETPAMLTPHAALASRVVHRLVTSSRCVVKLEEEVVHLADSHTLARQRAPT